MQPFRVHVGYFWFTFATVLNCAYITCSIFSYFGNSTTTYTYKNVNYRETLIDIHVQNLSVTIN